MSEKNGFFVAPGLDKEKNAVKYEEKTNIDKRTGANSVTKESSYFTFATDLDTPLEDPPRGGSSNEPKTVPNVDPIIKRRKKKKLHPPVVNADYPWFERHEFIVTQLRKEPYVIEKLLESITWMVSSSRASGTFSNKSSLAATAP